MRRHLAPRPPLACRLGLHAWLEFAIGLFICRHCDTVRGI